MEGLVIVSGGEGEDGENPEAGSDEKTKENKDS